jgi:hypothetical protein
MLVNGLFATPFLQASERGANFDNPPLQYDGPDPVAGCFVPVAKYGDLDLKHDPPPGGEPVYSPYGARLFEPTVFEDAVYGDAVDRGAGNSGAAGDGQGVIPFEDANVEVLVDEEHGLSEFKNGFFQRLGVTATWLPAGSGADGLGITELDSYCMVAVPMPTREWPLAISPTFNTRFLDWPNSSNLPPQVYETFLDLLWLPRLSPRWTGIVSVAPSLYTDFEVSTSEAFRWTGRGLLRFDWIPDDLQLLFGVLYLGRQDVRILPAGGLIWTPTADQRYELIFPRPKLARRILKAPEFEDWLFLGAEFGGNSYVYDDAGDPNILTLLDYRIYLGLERKRDGGAGYHLEIGYVFSRTAQFSNGMPQIDSPATAMLRCGFTF